ncbi:MAG TPA: lipocalin family protein [Flavipsychrobacter sp.]|nr:lipocalin family protein [Flavipsychrobacter sp.]
MKKITLAFSAMAVLAFVSCNKNDDDSKPATVKDKLKGTWKMSEYGADANSNGTLETGETAPTTGTSFGGSATYNADGTGNQIVTIMGTSDTFSFNWVLATDDKTLYHISDGDTITSIITELTTNRLVELTDESTPKSWVVFTK